MTKKKIIATLAASCLVLAIATTAMASTPTQQNIITPAPADTLIAEPGLVPEPTPQIETLDENTIVRSYEFVAQERPFNYSEAPKNFVMDGRTYTMVADSATYYVKGEAPHIDIVQQEFIETVEKSGINSQNDDIFDATFFIDSDGFNGEIPRTAVDYTTSSEQGDSKSVTTTVNYGEQPETPTAPESIEKNGTTYTFDGWEVNGDRWETNFYADLRLESDDAICKLESGDKIDLEASSPAWENIELALINEMKLDPGTHTIKSAKWQNSLQETELGYARKIRFTMQRHVANYTAVYTGKVAGNSHDIINGKATYRGTLEKEMETGVDYTVICKVTYQAPAEVTPEPTPTPTPAPEPEPEIVEEEPEEAGMHPILKFVLLILVAGGLGGAAFFGKNWWDKKNADDEEE